MRRFCLFVSGLIMGLVASTVARAETYQVGPGRTYRQLADLPALAPGDRVEVDGGADYEPIWFQDDGAPTAPIAIVGLRDANGARPRLRGGRNTVELSGDHYVFEGFDVSGGTARCVFHHAHDVTVRDCVIHDCPQQGLLGADTDSGSLLLEYTEIYGCGEGDRNHQVYMSTDQLAHPGSVFRMQYCWIHSGNGGNNVKSRAERNELYYNWIEGAYFHQLELIGPDPGGTPVAEDANREDSDIVGNVFIMNGGHPTHWVARFGGDATGQSYGRYRFVNNTVILAPVSAGIFRLFDGLESLEASNNVFFQTGAGDAQVVRDTEAVWASGRRVAGANNWVVSGTGLRDLPATAEWAGTIRGDDPGFEDIGASDLRPSAGSPLEDRGAATLPGFDFPRPLVLPAKHPPAAALLSVGTAVDRPARGPIDIGAYEAGGPGPAPDAGATGAPDAAAPGADAGMIAGGADAGAAVASETSDEGGCSCRDTTAARASHGAAAFAALFGLRAARRRRRPSTHHA